MKIYTTITDLKFSMSFANLLIRLLVQRFLIFSSKGALIHITCHHLGHSKLLYRSFLLITSPNCSSFCRRVPYIHCRLLPSPYFCIQICSGFHYLSLHNTRGRFFKFVFSNRKQLVSINGYDLELAETNRGISQGSVLGPLLFLLYINDLNQAIKFCKVHHFADDTNLLYLGKYINKRNKLVNIVLKNLLYWLNANKISLDVKKTELEIFKS